MLDRLRVVTNVGSKSMRRDQDSSGTALPLEMVAVELDKEVVISGGSVRVVKEQKAEVSKLDEKRDENGEKK